MAKYSFDFKKKVILAYLYGCGYKYLAKTYAFPVKQILRNGVIIIRLLERMGYCTHGKMTCALSKKLSVVKLYLSNEILYQDLVLQEGITNPSMITNWVNRFRAAGPDALRPHKKGQKD